MRRRATHPDTKLALLAALADGWSRLSPAEQLQVVRRVEHVPFVAGARLGPAGTAGRWCSAVVKGTVATTEPSAVYSAGSTLEHGGETAVVALTDGLLLTWPCGLLGPDALPLRLYPVATPQPS